MDYTLTFCLGLKTEEMTISLPDPDLTTSLPDPDLTISLQDPYLTTVKRKVPQRDPDMDTISKGVEVKGAGSQPIIASPKSALVSPCVTVDTALAAQRCVNYYYYGCGVSKLYYYYTLWWFWLLWTILILFSCCCAYRHRRAKLRIQQQQRQREIPAYHGACNYPTSMLDLSFLASLKLPSYEEVAARPNTPPPPYSSLFAVQGGSQYAHAGPSGIASSPSSDNYTSCSCESCSATSHCSTSFSVQRQEGPPVIEKPAADERPSPKPTQSPPKHTLFSSNVDFFEPDGHAADASDAEADEEDPDGNHFRHRRLTGDSGIEVCRCQVESEDEEEEEKEEGEAVAAGAAGAGAEERAKEAGEREEAEGQEEAGFLHDSVDCSARAPPPPPEDCAGLCGSAPGPGGDSVITVESLL
ncbi:hypothetical protein AAFF_G00274070 [Aldrovandia affinis]|uniref:WW domain binding protein 1 n=1 Tax=Aldrovandia affinis TaxID=143900 RepID=A0AAD7WSN2_9TELE|nr:hypothetical protein AAFF_G00274070 [Aldrovandia affinis]